jgi:D-glycero-alpha-D-manno-heptose-7-phosphate kinase
VIISRTPFRVSFFGGGTDYPAWYREEGGAVLSTTIDKYCYLSCRVLPPFFTTRHRIVWSYIENVSTIAEILHPAIREGLRFLEFDDAVGLEIQHQGDLPARSGVGSSSAFLVGLLKALIALRGQMISKPELAARAIELEQERLKEHVGCQDALAAAYGGLNAIYFSPDKEVRVEPVTIPASRVEELEQRLMLVYLGTSRIASVIAADVVANFANRRWQLRRMRATVDDFGHLLHEGWMLKRELSAAVSTAAVDAVYATAREHGALGGKLLGAGGTGFMLLYAPPERHAAIRDALATCVHVPFRFEREGSTLVYYNPDKTTAFER